MGTVHTNARLWIHGIMLLVLLLLVGFAPPIKAQDPLAWFGVSCEVANEYCCNCTAVDDGQREAEKGYHTNLTSRMDAEEGCRWIFKSETTECCYAAKEKQCRDRNHDEEKCRKKHTGFRVYPEYKYTRCTLELFNTEYKDAGNYTQITETFDFTIFLTVIGNRDWEVPTASVFSTLIGVGLCILFGWLLKSRWNKRKEMEKVEVEEKKKRGIALLRHLRNDEDSFKEESEKVDVLAAVDENDNNILHFFGAQWWNQKKTDLIYNCCENAHLFENQTDNEGRGLVLISTDKMTKISSLSKMENIINSTNKWGETPIHVAAKNRKNNVVKALLTIDSVSVNAVDTDSKWTHLHYAAHRGHSEIVNHLLEKSGIDKDAKAKDGKTPLLCAGSAGRAITFKVLLENGAQLNLTTEAGENIIHLLCKWGSVHENNGKIEILKTIINEQRHNTLMNAITNNENQSQDTVISSSSENETSFKTPLEIAVQSGHFEAAKLLIESGANSKTKHDENGQSWDMHLLCFTVLRGNKQFAEFLISQDQDQDLVNIRTIQQDTYLHVSIEKLNLNAVILLLNLNANKNHTNSTGKNALQFAEEKICNSPEEDRIKTLIISEIRKERRENDKEELRGYIEEKELERKEKENQMKESEGTLKKIATEMKKISKDERVLKEKLKTMEGDSKKVENDPEKKKRENPTLERIQDRVRTIIVGEEKMTYGQIAQVLKILNDTKKD